MGYNWGIEIGMVISIINITINTKTDITLVIQKIDNL